MRWLWMADSPPDMQFRRAIWARFASTTLRDINPSELIMAAYYTMSTAHLHTAARKDIVI